MSGYNVERVRFRAQNFTKFNPPPASATILAQTIVAFWRLGEAAGTFADSGDVGHVLTATGAGNALTRHVANASVSDDDGAITVNPRRTTDPTAGSVLYGEAQCSHPVWSANNTDFGVYTNAGQQFSMGCWINPGLGTTTNEQPIFCLDNGETSPESSHHHRGFWYRPSDDKIIWVYSSGSYNNVLIPAGSVSAGTVAPSGWTHVGVTWDTVNLKLYIGGVYDSTLSAPPSNGSPQLNVEIGSSMWDDSFTAQFFGADQFREFEGSVDDAYIVYQYAFTADEMATLAAG